MCRQCDRQERYCPNGHTQAKGHGDVFYEVVLCHTCKEPTEIRDRAEVCGTLMTPHPGDASILLGGARYCQRPPVKDGLCAVHLGHRKRRATNARKRDLYRRARAQQQRGA